MAIILPRILSLDIRCCSDDLVRVYKMKDEFMIKSSLTAAVAAICVAALCIPAYSLGGIVSNGTGTRTKIGVAQYKANLAVPYALKGNDGGKIIEADLPMSITLTIVSPAITKEKFISAVNEAFDNAASAGYPCPDRKPFISMFSNVTFAKGDIFSNQYEAGKGLSVIHISGDKTENLGIVGDLRFKKAFFAMFLGSRPIQASMKREMLGK